MKLWRGCAQLQARVSACCSTDCGKWHAVVKIARPNAFERLCHVNSIIHITYNPLDSTWQKADAERTPARAHDVYILNIISIESVHNEHSWGIGKMVVKRIEERINTKCGWYSRRTRNCISSMFVEWLCWFVARIKYVLFVSIIVVIMAYRRSLLCCRQQSNFEWHYGAYSCVMVRKYYVKMLCGKFMHTCLVQYDTYNIENVIFNRRCTRYTVRNMAMYESSLWICTHNHHSCSIDPNCRALKVERNCGFACTVRWKRKDCQRSHICSLSVHSLRHNQTANCICLLKPRWLYASRDDKHICRKRLCQSGIAWTCLCFCSMHVGIV